MTLHTPGPWHTDATDVFFQTPNGDEILIASLEHSIYRKAQPFNARLIAAAPDLLLACKAALTALSQPTLYHPADVDAAKKWLSEAIEQAGS